MGHIFGSQNFKDEISFSDTYDQQLTTPIFLQEEECFSDKNESYLYKSEAVDEPNFSQYRTAFGSPLKR